MSEQIKDRIRELCADLQAEDRGYSCPHPVPCKPTDSVSPKERLRKKAEQFLLGDGCENPGLWIGVLADFSQSVLVDVRDGWLREAHRMRRVALNNEGCESLFPIVAKMEFEANALTCEYHLPEE
jgi:hypothetical protein